MRREHKLEQSYIDWLKSLGCVFYAPLDYGNRTKDLISGIFGNDNQGSMTWNSNEMAYLCSKNSVGNASAFYWIVPEMPFSQYDWRGSILCRIKPVNPLDGGSFMYPAFNGREPALNMSNHDIYSSLWYNCAMVKKQNTCYWYCNGSFVYSYNYGALNLKYSQQNEVHLQYANNYSYKNTSLNTKK